MPEGLLPMVPMDRDLPVWGRMGPHTEGRGAVGRGAGGDGEVGQGSGDADLPCDLPGLSFHPTFQTHTVLGNIFQGFRVSGTFKTYHSFLDKPGDSFLVNYEDNSIGENIFRNIMPPPRK